MVFAVFVLFLLTSVGGALLFLSQNEVKMSKASLNSQEAFYMAEAGLEAARSYLWSVNGLGDFSDDLLAHAGDDTDISLIDPAAITPVFDSNGQLTGVNGVGDDEPLIAITVSGRGAYAAYLTNDPLEGRNNETDGNDRVSLVAVGVGPDSSFEVVEAIIERRPLIPMNPPAAITLMGPPPFVATGNSKVKEYIGEDCDGAGIAGLYLPIVGTIGSSAEAAAESGINSNPSYTSGPYSDEDTFADLTDPTEPTVMTGVGTIDPQWTQCVVWQETLASLREKADVICGGGSACVFPDYGPSRLIFIDGDYSLGKTQSGAGTLVVTGELTLHGNVDWAGLILVVGEGAFRLSGGGNGVVSGSMIVADIAGPDDVYGTADDCQGPSDGFDQGVYDERGGGNSGTVYCTADINASNQKPYEIVEFLQR